MAQSYTKKMAHFVTVTFRIVQLSKSTATNGEVKQRGAPGTCLKVQNNNRKHRGLTHVTMDINRVLVTRTIKRAKLYGMTIKQSPPVGLSRIVAEQPFSVYLYSWASKQLWKHGHF